MSALRDRRSATTNAGSAVDVTIPAIKPGQRARVRHLALHNQSGESVKVAFGILEGSTFHQLYAIQTVANGDAFGVLVDIMLLEGDTLDAQVTGTANKSTVTFIVSGELEDQSPVAVLVAADPPPGWQPPKP